MPAVVVPDLKRKFELLRLHTSRDGAALAAVFGRPVKTLQYWAHRSKHREAGWLPDWALPVLTGLIAEILPKSHKADDIRDLVFGPAGRLEEIVRSGASASMAKLLAIEARQGKAALIRKPGELGLVEVEEKAGASQPRLALDEWFRIEFPRRRGGRYAAVLQHAQQAWGRCPPSRRARFVFTA